MLKKALEIIAILIIIIGLAFAGYWGYNTYIKWQNKDIEKSKELEVIELLQKQQGTILTLRTEIAEIEKRVVTDTLKEKVVIKEEAPTYEAKKAEIIELKKEPEVNKEKIEVARVEFEDRINEFQASPDKILINTGDGKVVIYEDKDGNLVSLESGITITRHRDVEEVKMELGIPVIEKKDKDFNIGIIYNDDFTMAISYDLIDWKKFSFDVTAYDFESPKVGVDIDYGITDNIKIGAGVGLLDIKNMQIMDEKEFYLKLGIEF
jgi:hypothetical protein